MNAGGKSQGGLPAELKAGRPVRQGELQGTRKPAWTSQDESAGGSGRGSFLRFRDDAWRKTRTVRGSPRAILAATHRSTLRHGDEAGERLKIHRKAMPDSVRIRRDTGHPEDARGRKVSGVFVCGLAEDICGVGVPPGSPTAGDLGHPAFSFLGACGAVDSAVGADPVDQCTAPSGAALWPGRFLLRRKARTMRTTDIHESSM